MAFQLLSRARLETARVLLREPCPIASIEFSPEMNRPSRAAELRQLQRNAETMARLSPFKADREKFGQMAERYREEADQAERRTRP